MLGVYMYLYKRIPIILFLGIFGFLALGTFFDSQYYFEMKYSQEKVEKLAYNKAVSTITEALKSPSTANFLSVEETSFTKGVDDDQRVWMVKGWVDSQNSFGATVRSYWWVELFLSNYEAIQVIDFDFETR